MVVGGDNPDLRIVMEGDGKGMMYGLYQMPEEVKGYLAVVRRLPVMEGEFEVSFGGKPENVFPMYMANNKVLPLTSYFFGRIKVYMPSNHPTAFTLGSMRNSKIAVFLDKERRQLAEYELEPGTINLEMLAQLEEIPPITDEEVLKKFEQHYLSAETPEQEQQTVS